MAMLVHLNTLSPGNLLLPMILMVLIGMLVYVNKSCLSLKV